MHKPLTRELKKSYTPPVLTIYGTVQALTQKVGLLGHHDNGTRAGETKTHI
jgi:hypothetical protein